MVELKCHNCGATTVLDIDVPKEFVCPACGAVNVIPREMSSDAPLDCLAPTGFEWRMPAGKIGNPLTGFQYITAQGTQMSREEYLATFRIDPEIALQYLHREQEQKPFKIGGRR